MIPGLCEVTEPPLVEVAPGHRMSCHIPLEELGRLQLQVHKAAAEGEDVTLTSVAPALDELPEQEGGGQEPPDAWTGLSTPGPS